MRLRAHNDCETILGSLCIVVNPTGRDHIEFNKMLWVFVPVAGLILPVIILFLTRSRKTKCKIRKVGEPDRPITYDISDLTIPRMSGKSMLLMKWLATSWIKNILGAESIRKAGLDKLRTIDISDCPTIIPLPLPSCTPPTIEDKPIDFESFLTVDRKSYKSSFKFLSISGLTAAYRSGKVTPLQVAKRIIECIQNSDEKNPKMRAFTQYNKDEILRMAQASTQRYSDSAVLSFLDGVPVGLKEEFQVVPYFQQNGTTFWSKEPCDHDASVVKKLRDGGAIIIGMTNMHEIGIGVTGNNPNRLHGTPRNPYNVNYYTGGSSSGSAAAVASGLCLVGLGTDGGGSIRMPAGACGVVGIKASFGRINTAGVIHTAHTVSHAGPICNSVKDAALVYAYIAGPDPQDMCSISQPPVSLQGFNQTTLNGVRLGVDWNYFKHTDKEVFDQCEQAAKYLEGCGAKIVSVQIPELEETRVAHNITILVEMASGLNSMFDEYSDELNPDSVFALSIGKQLTGFDYYQAQKQRTRAMVFMEDIFNDVDCILTPGLGMKVPIIMNDALKHGEANTMLVGRMMRYMGLGNLTGIPGITFPVGYDTNGLPISLQVMSGWWKEHIMLRVAHACEGFVEHQKPMIYYDILG